MLTLVPRAGADDGWLEGGGIRERRRHQREAKDDGEGTSTPLGHGTRGLSGSSQGGMFSLYGKQASSAQCSSPSTLLVVTRSRERDKRRIGKGEGVRRSPSE